jgi:hypothetical protein
MKRSHGQSQTNLYAVWQAIKQRCSNPKSTAYSRYGARGIRVCERWALFANFIEDMGERPLGATLDRIDNNGPYSPENCRWATRKEQSNNREVNVRITYDGITLTAQQWSERTGVHINTLLTRFHKKYALDKVLSNNKFRVLDGLAIGGLANAKRQQAKTHCKRGHEYTPENTGRQVSAKGTPSRYCKACRRKS